jgi:hypothetical protein
MRCILLLLALITAAVPMQAARSFDGSTQSLSGTAPIASPPITLAAWFFPTDLTRNQAIVTLLDPVTDHAHFLILRGAVTGDPLAATSNQQPSTAVQALSSGSVTSGTWQHGAAVFASASSRSVYLNGVGATNSDNATTTGITTLRIGIFSISPGAFAGRIAEVGIWSAALSADEVASLARGLSPLLVRPSALVFYAPLWRAIADYRAALSLTDNGSTTLADHPRIYR